MTILPTSAELGMDAEATKVDELARQVLGDNYFHFQIDRVQVVDGLDDGGVALTCRLTRSGNGEPVEVEGSGVGLIDAFFDGVVRAYGDEYPSLKTISVADFSLQAAIEGVEGRKSDALARADLVMLNSEGTSFRFHHATPSIVRSSLRVALDALTFFLNCERAYVQLHVAFKDARERRRSDLVQRYRTQMSTLVAAASYSEVIERLRAEEDV